jgi:hypothetical protein
MTCHGEQRDHVAPLTVDRPFEVLRDSPIDKLSATWSQLLDRWRLVLPSRSRRMWGSAPPRADVGSVGGPPTSFDFDKRNDRSTE